MQNAQRTLAAVAARCTRLSQINACATSCTALLAGQAARDLPFGGISTQQAVTYAPAAHCDGFRLFPGVRGFAALKEITMPALSPTMTQGDLVEWKKKEGESMSPGDVIAVVETDKATLEWECQEEGFLAKIIAPDNSKSVAVGSVVGLLADDESDIASAASYVVGGGQQAPPAAAAPSAAPSTSAPSGASRDFPPHAVLKMPALSPTMTSGDIASWSKAVGDSIAPGDVLCEVGTDKATMAWEAQEEGYLAAIFKPSGTKDIQVGEPVALIVEEESAVAAFSGVTIDQLGAPESPTPAAAPPPPPPPTLAPSTPKPAATAAAVKPAPAAPKSVSAAAAGGRITASPYARKLAADAGVDLSTVAGSGPGGRIVASDVEAAIARGPQLVSQPSVVQEPAGTAFTDVQLNQIKRITAKRLLESKQTVPHYYLTMECNVDRLLQLRKQVNAQCEQLGLPAKLSVNDFIIKAAALALKKVPTVNSSWMGDFIRQYSNVDISVAVMTPAGLMVPVVRSADKIGLQGIGASVKALAQKAKENKLKPEEFSGGTFTVSNLGMYGVKQFAAIVNPPQSAILAVGSPQKVVVLDDAAAQRYKETTVLDVTLSCDHRVVDGAVGAEWLQAFKSYIENPHVLVV